MKDYSHIDEQIKAAKKKLTELEETRAALKEEINQLENIRNSLANRPMPSVTRMGSAVTNESPEHDKIALFRTLFRGREDVFARRFESKRSGKIGYQPVCNNEWIRPVCQKPTNIVDVAMIQSLSRKGVVDDIVADYGHLIVDECHHVSARSFEIVTRQCKAKYVTGLSATVVRKDGHHPIIFMNCGPVRFKVDDRKHAAKRAFSHEVIVRKTQFKIKPSDLDTGYGAIHEIYAALIENEARNKMIVADVMASISQGRFPVILTERKRHLEKLRVLLEKKIDNLIVMKGGMGKKQRKACQDALDSISDEAEKAILATGRYLGEGFDDKRLDTLFLTLPISWKGTLAQYAGRLHRDHDMKKTVMIYDYADIEVPMLARMFERRKTGYKAIGYSISE